MTVDLDRLADHLSRAEEYARAGATVDAVKQLNDALDLIAPNPADLPDVELDREEAARLLTARAFTQERDGDEPEGWEPRTIIHCRSGGFGADWDLAAVLALLLDAKAVGWTTGLLGHDLGIVRTADDRGLLFDVQRPERALYALRLGRPL